MSEDTRIKALEMYHDINPDDTIEIVSRLTGMYQFSGTKIIQNFLSFICFNTVRISTFLKLECAKSLLSFYEWEEEIYKNDEDEMIQIKNESNIVIKERNEARKTLGFKALNNVCSILVKDSDFPTPCKIDSVCMLMETSVFKEETCEYFVSIIEDLNLDCDFRYKTILSLEKQSVKLLNTSYYFLIKNTKRRCNQY